MMDQVRLKMMRVARQMSNVNRYDPLWGAMSIVMTYSGWQR